MSLANKKHEHEKNDNVKVMEKFPGKGDFGEDKKGGVPRLRQAG